MTDIVFKTLLDKRYRIEVQRTGDYTGDLVITDETNGQELLREPTTLSYQAIFGPDVGDVANWQERAIEFIDRRAQ